MTRADPRMVTRPRDWMNVAEVAARVGLAPATFRRRLAEFRAAGMPKPLPWARRELRFNAEAIEGWIARREAREGARPGPRIT